MSLRETSRNFSDLLSKRSRAVDASGIRRVFELGATLKDPYNFSIGQPDFPVPEAIKDAAIEAIRADRNGYTLTQGIAPLRARIEQHLAADVGWGFGDDTAIIVTAGTSGALYLAFLAMMEEGDEAVFADPYFVLYPHLCTLTRSRAVYCDTYPDGRLTAERVAPLLTDRSKVLLVNSPANPTGAVLTSDELRALVDLCEQRNILLITDEIYDVFTYDDARENGAHPSPARFSENLLLVRGFGKSYGCTGWRLGYAAGPRVLIEEMLKLQQYTYVCAPSMAQSAAIACFDVDMSEQVASYRRRRDMVLEMLGDVTAIVPCGGAFYAFVQVPTHLGLTASEFAEQAVERNVLVIPGKVFSRRDTHFRLSYAAPEEKLRDGLAIIRDMLRG